MYNQGTAATQTKSKSTEESEAARRAAALEARKREAARAAAVRAAELRKGPVSSTLYREDVYVGTHSQVWGSFFDKGTQRWGFACCCICDKGELNCPSASNSSSSLSRLRKHRKRAREHEARGNMSEPLDEDSAPCRHEENNRGEGVRKKQHFGRDLEVPAITGQGCTAASPCASRGPSPTLRETADSPSSSDKAGDVDSQAEGRNNKKRKAPCPALHRSREGGLSSVLQLLKEQNAFADD